MKLTFLQEKGRCHITVKIRGVTPEVNMISMVTRVHVKCNTRVCGGGDGFTDMNLSCCQINIRFSGIVQSPAENMWPFIAAAGQKSALSL